MRGCAYFIIRKLGVDILEVSLALKFRIRSPTGKLERSGLGDEKSFLTGCAEEGRLNGNVQLMLT